MKSFSARFLIFCFISVVAFAIVNTMDVYAGLLEMPRITDSTPLRGKSVFENMDIPSVRDRDPDPKAGPRIWVKDFKLQGIVERPKYGIYKKDIDEFTDKLRYLAMREGELLKFGYSLDELSEIADMMLEIDAKNNLEQVTEPDVQKLIWLVRQQKENRGLTLGQIEEIAQKITQFYREKGFFLAKVYIPEQEVRDGIVGLTLLEGKLGKVTISNNKHYDSDFIISTFNTLLYQPVTEQQIEQKLYLLNDYPGLNLYGFFKAGDQIGDTHLKLDVREEKWWTGTLRLDNHGSELTGLYRGFVQFQLHNPLGLADDVTIGALQSTSPDNATYGLFRYKVPLFTEQLYLGLNYSRNQFAIDDADQAIGALELSGETSIADITFEYAYLRSRTENLKFAFKYAEKESFLDSSLVPQDDSSQAVELSANWDSLDQVAKSLHQVKASVSAGEVETRTTISTIQIDPDYRKLNLSYSMLSFVTVPWTEDTPSRLILKSDAQYTKNVLAPVDQMSLAGPNAVRAYTTTSTAADRGVYIGLDWIFNMPRALDFAITEHVGFAQVAQPFVFLDYASGIVNGDGTNAEQSTKVYGWGMGIQFNHRNKISGNLQVAVPIDIVLSNKTTEEPEEEVRIIADFQYIFD